MTFPIAITLDVDELPDYNENGAKQTEHSYRLIVEAHASGTDGEQIKVDDITIYDTALAEYVPLESLSYRDEKIVVNNLRDYYIDNLGYFLDQARNDY